MKIASLLLAVIVPALTAQAAPPSTLPLPPQRFIEDGVTVIPVDTTQAAPALFLGGEDGKPFRSFDRLAASLARSGRTLVFAMNAGMYEADGSPVGLLVVDRKTLHPLNRRAGKGNFYLQPNGVFALTDDGPRVVTTAAYDRIAPRVRFATQSGPLLVAGGKVNPALDPLWARFTRNGVCAKGKTAYFVISDKPVSLYDFAVWFKDKLGCADALYLDGNVSSLYSTALGRYDRRDDLGPLIGVAR